MSAEATFTERIIMVIKSIPYGKVVTYGQVASMAGNHRGARQVSWVLNSFSEKEGLPWFRVINGKGKISLTGEGFVQQKYLLEEEGVFFDEKDRVDLGRFLWDPEVCT